MKTDAIFDSSLKAAQQPTWPDQSAVKAVVDELSTYPPLVFAGECDNLKDRIALSTEGKAFWLKGGDCAETFWDSTAD